MSRSLTLLAVALMAACTIATEGPAPVIDAPGIEADVAALSADDMEGRGTGTEGERRAAAYLESRMREIGLQPLDGSYRQEVRLVGMKRDDAASSLSISGPAELPLQDGVNVSYWSTLQQPQVSVQDAPLVFVGYGVEAPEYGWDDFKGLDASGKVLLFLNDDPPVSEQGVDLFGGVARTYYGRWTYKFEQAMRHGAAGAIVVHTTPSASYPFSVVSGNGRAEHFAVALPGAGYQVPLVGWLNEEQSAAVAAALGTDLAGLLSMAASRDFEPRDTGYRVNATVTTVVREIVSENVAGILPGSDDDLGEQIIVFSAHYDHLGTDASLEGDDKIRNGAWDNASGTAAILALAEAFTAGEPTRRSLLFLACTAEEAGSLGSGWFVANPPVPRSRLVANFNIDMPQIFGVTRDIAAIGVDTSSLGDAFVAAAAGHPLTIGGQSQPLMVTGDPNPSAGSFYRSDQVNFAKAGIPALYLQPGQDYAEELAFDPVAYEEAHYHQVSDELRQEWNLSGMVRDLKVIMDAARAVANADDMPRWRAGNEFEDAWLKLHGQPGQ